MPSPSPTHPKLRKDLEIDSLSQRLHTITDLQKYHSRADQGMAVYVMLTRFSENVAIVGQGNISFITESDLFTIINYMSLAQKIFSQCVAERVTLQWQSFQIHSLLAEAASAAMKCIIDTIQLLSKAHLIPTETHVVIDQARVALHSSSVLVYGPGSEEAERLKVCERVITLCIQTSRLCAEDNKYLKALRIAILVFGDIISHLVQIMGPLRSRAALYPSEMKMQQGASESRVYKREAHTQATSNDAASSFPMSIESSTTAATEKVSTSAFAI